MSDEPVLAYVGFAPCCGTPVAASMILPNSRQDNARFVAALIRKGYSVEQKPIEWVRAANFKQCRCKEANK